MVDTAKKPLNLHKGVLLKPGKRPGTTPLGTYFTGLRSDSTKPFFARFASFYDTFYFLAWSSLSHPKLISGGPGNHSITRSATQILLKN